MELKVNLAGILLEHPLMNAAGTCKLLEGSDGARELTRSAAAAVMVGSITLEPRQGNEGQVYWASQSFSLNSLGLPNPGAGWYQEHLPEIADVAHKAGKPLFVSVAGFKPLEYAGLTLLAFSHGADLVELNLSCPNVWESEKQKRIACFDPRLVEEILNLVKRVVEENERIAVKLSPFSDLISLAEVAKVISRSGVVKAVTVTNVFPNAFSLDERGKSRIVPVGGLAGLAGPALKPIGLGQVKQLRELLPQEIDIIGVGGIANGQDILDYLRAGAKVCQIATALMERRGKVFGELLTELVNLTNES